MNPGTLGVGAREGSQAASGQLGQMLTSWLGLMLCCPCSKIPGNFYVKALQFHLVAGTANPGPVMLAQLLEYTDRELYKATYEWNVFAVFDGVCLSPPGQGHAASLPKSVMGLPARKPHAHLIQLSVPDPQGTCCPLWLSFLSISKSFGK